MNQGNNNSNSGGTNQRGPDPGTTTGTCGTRRHNKTKAKWNRSKQAKNTFTGKTKEMNRHVFQLHAEQKKKGQFRDTLDQLRVYSSSVHKKEIKDLKVLFTHLTQPVLTKPEKPVESSTVEQTMFLEEF